MNAIKVHHRQQQQQQQFDATLQALMADAGCDWDFIEVDIAGKNRFHHNQQQQQQQQLCHQHCCDTGKLETSDHAPLDFLFKTTGEEL